MDRLITVTGAGVATASPDTVRIDGEITGRCDRYADAVKASADSVADVKKAIGEAGFDMDDLRTSGFSVAARYRTEERDGARVSVFDGFGYSHTVTMTIPAGDDGLGRLLEALLESPQAPEFRFSYLVSDPSKAVSEAREAAVRDARCRAKELASAAGVRLGEVVSISYVSSPCAPIRGRMLMASGMGSSITPEDSEYHESVTVQWTIAD